MELQDERMNDITGSSSSDSEPSENDMEGPSHAEPEHSADPFAFDLDSDEEGQPDEEPDRLEPAEVGAEEDRRHRKKTAAERQAEADVKLAEEGFTLAGVQPALNAAPPERHPGGIKR